MKLVIQRVKSSQIKVNNNVISSTNRGILILVGISKDCNKEKVDYLARKVLNLRLFESEKKGFDLSVSDIKGEIMIVSQFTLHGIVDGNKPNFRNSAQYEDALEYYNMFVEKLKESELNIQTGEFGAMMEVELINDGPVTIVLEK